MNDHVFDEGPDKDDDDDDERDVVKIDGFNQPEKSCLLNLSQTGWWKKYASQWKCDTMKYIIAKVVEML